jgi:O-antigen/teichoic acid export membrane protein
VVVGRVPETLVAPGLFLLFAAVAGLTWQDAFSASWAIALLVVATILAFAVGAGLLARALPGAVREVEPRFESRSWARSATPLVVLGLVGVLSAQAGTILLGVFADAEDTGVFALALRLSMFASFLFLASTYPLMPVVARLHSLGDLEQMRRTVHRAARALFLCSLPVGLAIALFADPLLGVFGADFRTGTQAVRILVLAELVKVFFGLSGLLLVMTGHEDDFARGVILGSILNVGLSLLLIPPFSIGGAAVAAAVATVVTHLVLTSLAHRRLGFAGTAWSIADISRRRRRPSR